MRQRLVGFPATVAFLVLIGPDMSVAHQDPDSYERGQALLEAGNVTDALDLWASLSDSLTTTNSEDPRIGTAFIAAVARHNLARYDELGTQMFYWGFSGMTPTEDAVREILAEGRRTFVLVDSAVALAWQDAGQESPASLALAIKQFWIERDPTPTTVLNERLLEHWSRVAYARENHVYSSNSAFGTDDRGTVYVKYGPPAQATAGHLKISSSEAQWRGVEKDDFFRWDVEPRYEIWRYGTLEERSFTYFMFGNVEGTGPFRLVTGPHELLPGSARYGPGSRVGDIRAQYFMELFYYVELARAGGPFGVRLGELEALWNQGRGRPNEGYLEAASLRYIEDDVERAAASRIPSWSEIDDAPKSALSAQVARIVQDAEPRLLVVAVSSPRWTPDVADGTLPDELDLDDYTPGHTVIVRDHQLHEVARATMASMDSADQLSTLVLRHNPAIVHLSVAAEHQLASSRSGRPPSVFPGHRHFPIAPPLTAEPAAFEVSDLVVGIAPQPEFPMDHSPVPLLPATRFWRDDLLRVYFELYRPADAAADGPKRYSIKLQIVPTAQDFVQNDQRPPLPPSLQEGGGPSAVSVDIESTGLAHQHFFDLDLRNEVAGYLRLVLEVVDPLTGATEIRDTLIRLLPF